VRLGQSPIWTNSQERCLSNGDANTEEVEHDMMDEVSIPQKDCFVMRKGRRWKVVQINEQRELTPRVVPIFRVFLTSNFWLLTRIVGQRGAIFLPFLPQP